MPELPEIEHLRRTLEPQLVGMCVLSVDLRRRDVLRSCEGKRKGRVDPHELLVGDEITQLIRHGKNLAIIAGTGRLICVHLGMTGQLFIVAGDSSPPRRSSGKKRNHVHCIWRLQRNDDDDTRCHLVFRDSRRFGGLWMFNSIEDFRKRRICQLGPDALTITSQRLRKALTHSARPIKSALLDQAVLAGVGNIYADEALFLAGIDPRSPAHSISSDGVAPLAVAIRKVLRDAIHAGGSSIRDYIDGNGKAGGFAMRHKVYGRGNEPCIRCGNTLKQGMIAQRTTVWCAACQRLFR